MQRRLRSKNEINEANEHVFHQTSKRHIGHKLSSSLMSSLRLADSVNVRSEDRYQKMLIQAHKAGIEVPKDFMNEKLGLPTKSERQGGKKTTKGARK